MSSVLILLLSTIFTSQYYLVTSESVDFSQQLIELFTESALCDQIQGEFRSPPFDMWKEIAEKELSLYCSGRINLDEVI